MQFCDKLKKFREDLNLTQEQFSEETRISRGLIGMMEAGKRPPSKKTLETLATYSHKSMDWWYGKEDKQKKWDGLNATNTLIDYMIEQGTIVNAKNIDTKTWDYIRKMLEAEIDNKLKNKDTGSVNNE